MQITEGLVTWQVSTTDCYDDHRKKNKGAMISDRMLLINESPTGSRRKQREKGVDHLLPCKLNSIHHILSPGHKIWFHDVKEQTGRDAAMNPSVMQVCPHYLILLH